MEKIVESEKSIINELKELTQIMTPNQNNMKTTNFFTEMGKFAEHADLKFTISLKGETMSVTMMPDVKNGAKRVRDFTATGTVHELDEGFIPELAKGIEEGGGFKTNTAQFTESVKEENKAAVEKAKEKPKSESSTKKAAPAKKKVASSAKKSTSGTKKLAPAAKKSTSKVKPPEHAKRKPNPDLTKPMVLSEALQAICGTEPLGKTAVVKKLWSYIKEHKLQDKKDKKKINCDEVLKKIFDPKETIKMHDLSNGIMSQLTPVDEKGDKFHEADLKEALIPEAPATEEKKTVKKSNNTVREKHPQKTAEKKEKVKEEVAEAPKEKGLFD